MLRAISKAAIAFWLIAAAMFPGAATAQAASSGAPPPSSPEAATALAAAGKFTAAYAIYRQLAAAMKLADDWRRGEMKTWAAILLRTP